MSTNLTTDAGNIAGTPLTDAKARTREVRDINSFYTLEEVTADFSRALERQLNQSREATAQAERERSELRENLRLTNEGRLGWNRVWKEECDKNKELRTDLATARAERDGRETDLMTALNDLAAETAKNAELQGYIRKLARLLGCTDGDDSPELGIKELIADRAALREKLAIAEKALNLIANNHQYYRSVAANAMATLRGNDKAEKGA